MKYFILFLIIVFSGCLTDAPKRKDFKYGTCFEAAFCGYQNANSKKQIDCSREKDACSKIRTMGDCLGLTKDSNGNIFTFQSCWDKLR